MKAGKLCIAAVAACACVHALTLEEGFRNPPNSAKPHTWYHMMNGNVTKEGITRDFEEIAKAGLGGVQMFDAGCNIPPGSLDFNSPEWFDMFKHAASEARRLGLEICIPNCSGWSSSGGPWNMPSNGMKKVVFTEIAAKGPSKFAAKLPRKQRQAQLQQTSFLSLSAFSEFVWRNWIGIFPKDTAGAVCLFLCGEGNTRLR